MQRKKESDEKPKTGSAAKNEEVSTDENKGKNFNSVIINSVAIFKLAMQEERNHCR
jgi:hypothetical protein